MISEKCCARMIALPKAGGFMPDRRERDVSRKQETPKVAEDEPAATLREQGKATGSEPAEELLKRRAMHDNPEEKVFAVLTSNIGLNIPDFDDLKCAAAEPLQTGLDEADPSSPATPETK